MAAICYEDGFVLVGSVSGQRFWSHLFDLNNSSISSITWTPDDSLVLLGLSSGTIMVVDKNGTYLTRVNISNESITHLIYNSQKFFMDEETTTIKLQTNSKKKIFLRLKNSYFNSLQIVNLLTTMTIYWLAVFKPMIDFIFYALTMTLIQ